MSPFSKDDHLVTVAEAPTETEASILAGVIRSHGLDAQVVGAYTANFLTSAPGSASVVVRQHDAAKAQQVLALAQGDLVDFDWEQVDVGKPDAP